MKLWPRLYYEIVFSQRDLYAKSLRIFHVTLPSSRIFTHAITNDSTSHHFLLLSLSSFFNLFSLNMPTTSSNIIAKWFLCSYQCSSKEMQWNSNQLWLDVTRLRVLQVTFSISGICSLKEGTKDRVCILSGLFLGIYVKGLDLEKTSNPSLTWKMKVFKMNDSSIVFVWIRTRSRSRSRSRSLT